MLNHYPTGPDAAGKFHVIYRAAGQAPTAVCECTTLGQAKREAKRLNDLLRSIDKQHADDIARAKFYRIRFKHDRK